MPFRPAEQVNLRFEANPTTARLHFNRHDYTTHNGGLTVQRDGALTCTLQLPATKGAYTYQMHDGDTLIQHGKLRVTENPRPEPANRPTSQPRTPQRWT
jgi:hypothetical protein